ncbi:MAG: hypothetical protein ABL904_03955 [Hyphomicrobiaceae bacterium]
MSKRTGPSIATVLSVAVVALVMASCGIEAAEQPAQKTSAEAMIEKFSEPAVSQEKLADAQAKIDAQRQKSEAARKLADAKRAEEKARKEAAAKATEQAKADEAEMLAQARAEANERRAAMELARTEHENAENATERKAQEDAAKAYEAQKFAARQAEEKLIADAKAQAAERERVAEEQKQAEIKAATAKRDAEAKAFAEAKAQAAERERVIEEQNQAEIKAATAKRDAEAKAFAEAKAQAAERERVADQQKQAELKALEARREAEAKVLAEKLREAEAAREAKAAEATRKAAIPTVPAPALRPAAAPAVADTVVSLTSPPPANPRVAILILMEAGNKGIRRFEKTADPILCMRDGCYISEGTTAPARLLSRARALGVGNTWGKRAGACQHSLGCVFRDVELFNTGGFIQPVDMKVMVHDRRESRTVDVDSDCRLEGGRISCRKPVVANGYRMWVIPEPLATRAGGDALDAAVRDGLPQSTSAGLGR